MKIGPGLCKGDLNLGREIMSPPPPRLTVRSPDQEESVGRGNLVWNFHLTTLGTLSFRRLEPIVMASSSLTSTLSARYHVRIELLSIY